MKTVSHDAAMTGILKTAGIVIALLAAAALGYCLHPSGDKASSKPEAAAKVRRPPPAPDRGDAARIAALRRRVRSLEAQLAESRKNGETAVSNAIARTESQFRDRPPPRMSGRERLEELKKSDPERFAQITNRMATMHRERKTRQAARVSFLSSVNTSGMSADDRETHEGYQQLLARREELEERLHQPDMTEEARHELMKEMHEVNRQMREAGEEERKVLLGEIAKTIGMEGDAANELVETVSDVFDATSNGGGHHGGFDRPGGPPPPR